MSEKITKEQLADLIDGRIAIKGYEDVPSCSSSEDDNYVLEIETLFTVRILLKGISEEDIEEEAVGTMPSELIRKADGIKAVSSMQMEKTILLDDDGEEALDSLWD